MKKFVYPVIILSIILLIANCPAPFNSIDMPGFGGQQLPQDEVSYTSRSFSEDFTYKTLFPVQLDITAKLYDQSADNSGEPEPLSSDTANVKLKLVNASGTVVFESLLGTDGHLKTAVYLPAVSEDITLTLQADGFKTREVVIEDMVEYSSITRTMSMGRSDSFVSAKGMELDSDGDGVPDSYDVEAFQVNIPADGKLTVAYEDLYGRANAGDADYNDFITAYSITETISSDGTKLEKIYVEASGKEKLAGYDHIFGFRLNSFSGLADISGEYVDWRGNTRSFELLDQESPVNIELFKSTSVAKDKTAHFTVTFQEKQNIDESVGDIVVDRPPYNPYLYVKNTGNDVHLIGEESLDGTYNSFMDENHFPWALLLPIDWDPPAEGQRIEEKYPRFTRWRESGGELSRDWYLHNDPWEPEEPNEPVKTLELAADINSGSVGSSPMYLTEYGGELYFSADDGSSGRELWKYDPLNGTAELVEDFRPSGDSGPNFLEVFDGNLYFSARAEDEIFQFLYRHDGSNTERVTALTLPMHLEVYENELFMGAREESTGQQELWSYDVVGTETLVADINQTTDDNVGSAPYFLVEYNGELFYSADDGVNGRELWRYNVTDGALLAADINGSGSGLPQYLTVYEGDLYFQADDGSTGRELWKYSGGSANRITNLDSGTGNGLTSSEIVVYSGKLYFAGNDGSGVELWSYDAIADEVSRVAVSDLDPSGIGLMSTTYFSILDNTLYFGGSDGSAGYELYRYDGSEVSLAAEINSSGDSSPKHLTVMNGRLYFSADDGTTGEELWVYY